MILFPAIDLKNGKCVRLVKGNMELATVFNDDPAAQAVMFREQGFSWIHVIDLNGAFEGRSINGDAVEAVLAEAKLPVQLGGGIRTMEDVEVWLARGVARVVLGTAAVRDPEFVRTACAAFPGQVAVSIDARGGRVAVEGWAKEANVNARELAFRCEDAGVAVVIYTDIDRDGALTGLNVEATAALATELETPVVASGGVASLNDLRALKKCADTGIICAISGRAIYDGRLDASAALALLAA